LSGMSRGVEGANPVQDRKYKIWRIRAFVGTWIAYAGFYFCRKTIAVAQPEFMKQYGWGTDLIGVIITGYNIGYSVGQLVNGALCDKYGPRIILALGFAMTIIFNVLFGLSSSITLMGIFWTANGYAQACGWPSVIRGMSNWFSLKERGKIMGFWGPCYAVGDVVGTGLAAFVIGHTATQTTINPLQESVTFTDWRWVFWVAAIALSAVAVISLYLFRNEPKDVGLPDITEYHNIHNHHYNPIEKKELWHNVKKVVGHRQVVILAVVYMGVKFIRYTFISWSVTYLVFAKGLATDAAGYISTFYASVGILGTISASYLSDKLFASRRAPISVIMLLGLVFALLFFWKAPIPLIPIAIGLVGFMNYGPDFVISAVAAMDFGSRKGAGTTAGFINSIGTIGQALSGVVIGVVAGSKLGWDTVFYILIGISLACAILLSTMWNEVGEN